MRVRFIRASRSRSAYWLKAPALAEDRSTASARTTICQAARSGPGVTAMPASAHSMMATPMRSLNTGSAVEAVVAMMLASGPAADQPNGQISDRYFQLTK